jgi:hypothetical protein
MRSKSLIRRSASMEVQRHKAFVVALTLAVGTAVGAIGNHMLMAQSTPVTRTMLQQKDLEGPEGRELIMYRADFSPGGL